MADPAEALAGGYTPTLAAAPAPVALPMGLEERKRRAKIAEALAMQSMDVSPVQSWTQGAARVANGLVGAIEERKLDREERTSADQLQRLLLANPALGGGGAAAPAAAPGARVSDAGGPAVSPSVGAGVAPSDAISSIESGGKYDSQGVVIPKTGDRAYGKYQVMGANVPAWTREHYGQELTPQQFLANPDAQEAVFKGEFGKYVNKYGPEGASRAWFAGEPNMNNLAAKDPLGTSVADYSRKFQTASLGPAAAPGGPPGVPSSVANAFQPSTPSLAPAAAPGPPADAAAAAGGAVAAAPAAPGTPAAATPVRSMTPMDPQTQAYVKMLVASRNPQAAALAQKIVEQYSKPAELKPMIAGTKGYTFNPATGQWTQAVDADKPKFAKFGPSSVIEEGSGKVTEVPGQGFRPLTDPAERGRFGIAANDTRPYQVGPGGELHNPPPEMQREDFEHSPDGRILNKHTGQYVTAAAAGFKPLVDPAERAAHGIPADDKRPYQVDSAGKLINPPAETRINIDQKGEGSFETHSAQYQAKRFDDLVKQSYDAKAMIADLSNLRDLGSRIPNGTSKSAEFKNAIGPYAEMLGVKVDGLSDMQAYNAVVSRLQPRMRVPGSGSTSDYEMRTFLAALPSLGKTPEGNAIIANTLEALQQQHLAAGEIASKALGGDIKRAEAEKQLRELADPFELWKKSRGKAPSAPQKTSAGVNWSVE